MLTPKTDANSGAEFNLVALRQGLVWLQTSIHSSGYFYFTHKGLDILQKQIQGAFRKELLLVFF